jgi:hypothetical protein
MIHHQIVSAIAVALSFMLAPSALTQTDRARFDSASIPFVAIAPQDFVPLGWTLEEQHSGDLNGDGKADLALNVVQERRRDEAAAPVERQRLLIILLKAAGEQWRRAALATRLLLCTACGGAFYGVQETPVQVSIVKGVVLVKQTSGSRNLLEQTFRFRYNAKMDKFLLIGVDLADRDRATGALVEESSNFLTGEKVTSQARFDERTQKYLTQSSRRSRVPVQRIMLDDVDYESYRISADNNGSH